MSPEDKRHGTNAGYAYGGCRLECCRRAHAMSMNLWRMGRKDKLIPATGTHRRVEALMTLGWSRAELSAMLGHRREYLTKIRDQDKVTESTAAKIRDLYERLCMTPAPAGSVSSKVRKYAERHGYVGPLSWDDIDQDEKPAGLPKGRKFQGADVVDEAVVIRVLNGEILPTKAVDRREIMRRWLAAGRTERSLCARMGWAEARYSPRSVGDAAHTDATDRRAS